VNTLWLANGLLFYILLFATGQWHRLVPTSFAAFPHAVSVLVQYLSLDWPTENGWVAYNSLQQFAYCITVFVAAPLAVLTVLVWFLVFIVMHVALVATTGVLRNLNHIYTGRDGAGWVGFGVFTASMVM